ncbi:MAG: LamG-like jellyroll fold domain-containing protein [bacterium]
MKRTILPLLLIFTILFLINTKSTAQMYWNQAANFTGSNTRYIAVPNSPTLNITSSFTLEAWMNPASLSGVSKGIISKGGPLGTALVYGLRLLSTGKLNLITNGSTRLASKSIIPVNKWTHVSASFDSSQSKFTIYINGVIDTSSIIAGADPVSNTDSLYIGISGSSTPYNGMLDEVRVWNEDLSGFNLFFFRSTIGLSGGGILNSLILSMPMQNNTGSGTLFSTQDFSTKGNNGNSHNVLAVNLQDLPSGNVFINDCMDFSSGPGGALTGVDNPSVSPTSKVTIECWVFPKNASYTIAYKGPPIFGNPNYQLHVSSLKLGANINGTLLTSSDTVPLNKWSHVAFTYFGATGRYEFFVNGKRGTAGNKTPGNIPDGSDSLIIGAGLGGQMKGYLDELRIIHDVKSINEINSSMFESINESNDDDAFLNAVYNFDGLTWGNTDGSPLLNLRLSATPSNLYFSPLQSPVNNNSDHEFQKGFYTKLSNKRIPASGSTGFNKDTIDIPISETISDLNIYIAINHKREDHLRLTLTSPLGTGTEFYSNYSLLDSLGNIVTVFDTDADSMLSSNKYVSFGPRIKPQFDLDAIFAGNNTKGKWILTVNDDAGSDTGLIVSWGIQFNNKTSVPVVLNCTSLIEGFYNPLTNSMTADTMRFILRSSLFPYPVIDSSKALLSNTGTSLPVFNTAEILTDYFIQLKHRNSLETWSSSPIKFEQVSKSANYDFTTAVSKSFGDNTKQVDSAPVKFAIYSGDQNQDGNVDVTDIVNVFNDANNFNAGYINSDMNGDDFADAADLIITYNNSISFVEVIRP